MVSQAKTTNMCSTQYSLQTIQTSCLLLTVEGPGPHLVGGGGGGGGGAVLSFLSTLVVCINFFKYSMDSVFLRTFSVEYWYNLRVCPFCSHTSCERDPVFHKGWWGGEVRVELYHCHHHSCPHGLSQIQQGQCFYQYNRPDGTGLVLLLV